MLSDNKRNPPLTCIAIDDEPEALEVLKIHVQKISFVDLKACFTHPLKAIEFLRANEVDFILLDIQMPDVSGLQLVQALPIAPLIIFTTAFPNYAVKSYELEAVDYLVKPIEFDRFLKAVFKIQHRIENKGENNYTPDFLFVKSGPSQIKLEYNDIIYIESDGNYIAFHTKERKYLSRISMSEIAQNLPPKQFLRIHKSYLINLKYLKKVENYRVLISEIWLPIGRKYKTLIRTYSNAFTRGN
ncbi:LytTR family DNA-binding domain-containing protein [Fulvivirgaceae bacterium BMA10]|uniref:LytTR family DNA-binding domain-containing protein n=1 Tax=Splendidivirga corallicola TaxID=3051826 RepID=A0ABT8KJU2_9BACT|nr:LytTR family DNA-binding domain-containing protein [Fulvivirgaceae bacterium BMA10]